MPRFNRSNRNGVVDAGEGNGISDSDSGTTRTNPLLVDTDSGGVTDGDEDTNHSGVVDSLGLARRRRNKAA